MMVIMMVMTMVYDDDDDDDDTAKLPLSVFSINFNLPTIVIHHM